MREILLREDGTVIRRETVESQINVTDSVFDSISRGVTRKFHKAFPLPEYETVAHICAVSQDLCYVTIPLTKLYLLAQFTTTEDGILVPDFGGRREVLTAGSNPFIAMEWTPPADMKLIFMVECYCPGSAAGICEAGDHYLAAFDNDGRSWRLPLPNVFEDSKMCRGDYDTSGSSVVEIANRALAQLKNGKWNSDLWNESDNTRAMFRFKPKESGGFEQLPVENWTAYCAKVGTSILNYAVL